MKKVSAGVDLTGQAMKSFIDDMDKLPHNGQGGSHVWKYIKLQSVC